MCGSPADISCVFDVFSKLLITVIITLKFAPSNIFLQTGQVCLPFAFHCSRQCE